MPGPGSVQMTDADDVIEIFSSDSAEEDQDGSEAEMSEGSDDYYNSSEEGSDLGGLGDEGRPTSTTEKRLPYRIIDPDLLKQVQVSDGQCADSAVCTPQLHLSTT